VANPYTLNMIDIQAGASGFAIDGSPLLVAGPNPLIQDDSGGGGGRVINPRVQIEGAVRFRGRSAPLDPGLTLKEVSGSGSLAVATGKLRIDRATYTGTTTVTAGILAIGGWTANNPFHEFVTGSTEGQADYLIHPAPFSSAGLVGTGTIGLKPGKQIVVEAGGYLDPDYDALGPVATTLTVNGNVRFGDGGRYRVWSSGRQYTDLLDVNGVLDLTGVGDVLELYTYTQESFSVVVADYQSRLGEFDVLRPVFNGGRGTERATIRYTSAAEDGPGQVIVTVTVPEPAAGFGIAAASIALLARRRRRCASCL
jgi:hypothetical protein